VTACLKVRRSPDGPIVDVFVDGPASRWVDAKGKPIWDWFMGAPGDTLMIRDPDGGNIEYVRLETAVDVPEESNDE
jgi:hypothetical protein